MSYYIKRQIDSVKDNIYFLKHEHHVLHHHIYVCYHQELLYEYFLTLKETDNKYNEFERFKKRYKMS